MQTQYKGPHTRREKYTLTTTGISPNKGFYVNVAGTLNCKLRGETAEQAMPVVAGHHYEMDIEDINFVGTVTVTQVWVLFGASI